MKLGRRVGTHPRVEEGCSGLRHGLGSLDPGDVGELGGPFGSRREREIVLLLTMNGPTQRQSFVVDMLGVLGLRLRVEVVAVMQRDRVVLDGSAR